jgi:hypothetical protein
MSRSIQCRNEGIFLYAMLGNKRTYLEIRTAKTGARCDKYGLCNATMQLPVKTYRFDLHIIIAQVRIIMKTGAKKELFKANK